MLKFVDIEDGDICIMSCGYTIGYISLPEEKSIETNAFPHELQLNDDTRVNYIDLIAIGAQMRRLGELLEMEKNSEAEKKRKG